MSSLLANTSKILQNMYKQDIGLKYKVISSYAKIYPDKIKIIKYFHPLTVDRFRSVNGLANEELTSEKDNLQKSINRTKTKISDYVLCNNFTHFATFTFDPNNPKVKGNENRKNFNNMSDLLKNWLNTEQINHQRKHGSKFKYLIVPERHKNGAWHFHALLEDYKNEVRDFYSSKNPYITVNEIKTAKRYKGRNYLVRYNLGRSEVAPIRDKTKMSSYIKKYITKELITEKYAKRYWSSRNLIAPEVIENLAPLKMPEEYRTQIHDYHEIYEVPYPSDYADFLLEVDRVERVFSRNKLDRLLQGACYPTAKRPPCNMD